LTQQTQRHATLPEPFERDQNGRPVIADTPAQLYAFGSLIREVEQALLDLFSRGQLSGTTHTCLGQELCQMAVVRVLRDPGDAIFSNHRNHGHFLTYSGNCLGLLAEIMGREDGVCKGLGGSQHILYRGFHSNGVQAGLTAVAVGNALRRKLAGETGITAAFIGDGTLGEGLLYESLNLASVWQVPVLFVVENNRIAQTTPAPSTIAGGTILLRGKAFGLSCWCFNDDDPDFFQRVEGVLETVRSLNAPGFLVINTDRLGPHSKGDDLRSAGELGAAAERDPLNRLLQALPPDRVEAAEQRVASLLAQALEKCASAAEMPLDEFLRVTGVAA